MQLLSMMAFVSPMLVFGPAALASPLTSGLSANETRILRARQAGYQTSCEVGDGNVIVQDESGNEPAAFTILWDAVDNELCSAQGCYFGRQKCVLATASSEVCISAQGDFLREQRDDFIYGARHIFDRTVQRGQGSTDTPLGYFELGTNLVDFQAVEGDYSGFGIRVQLTMRDLPSGQCPNTVSLISGIGAALPEVGAVFGLIGFFCNQEPEPRTILQATG